MEKGGIPGNQLVNRRISKKVISVGEKLKAV
jgi:hypothetical protein